MRKSFLMPFWMVGQSVVLHYPEVFVLESPEPARSLHSVLYQIWYDLKKKSLKIFSQYIIFMSKAFYLVKTEYTKNS